jgi:hypothetical protein
MSTELEAVLAEADALFRERFKGRKVMFVLWRLATTTSS